MRILMDFEMNRKLETFNGIRVADIEEFQSIRLEPSWQPGCDIDDMPDGLVVSLYNANDTDETCCSGEYVLDGTGVALSNALKNYNKVVNQLLVTGYARISDFENVIWW